MMLAQIVDVDPGFLKQAVLLVIGLLAGAGSVATVVGVLLRRRSVIEPQPLVVTVPEISRRLDGHDKEITNIWNTMRDEDALTRDEMRKCFQHIERSLGRIEGKLEER